MKSHQNISSFYLKKNWNSIKKGIVSCKKLFQVILTMIMFTRSSERNVNPSRYTGKHISLSICICMYVYAYIPYLMHTPTAARALVEQRTYYNLC